MGSIMMKFGRESVLLALVAALSVSSPLRAQQERGWVGINFECNTACEELETDSSMVWSFSTPPLINWVYEGGPAYEAGIRPGDLLLGVDGLNIVTEEGGRRFASIRLGVPMTFWLQRGEEQMVVTVTPATCEAALGEYCPWAKVSPSALDSMQIWMLDSLQIRMKQLYEGRIRLQYALREAEQALRRADARQAESPEQQQLVMQLRSQIDSLTARLLESQRRFRLRAESLAVRTLRVSPQATVEVETPEVRVVPSRGEARRITVYRDAVAGARFEELEAGSPLLAYFPGVEQGLLVLTVVEDTPAEMAGLREGDVVLAVSDEPVTTVAEFRRLVNRALRHRGEAELTYVRRGKKQSCTLSKH